MAFRSTHSSFFAAIAAIALLAGCTATATEEVDSSAGSATPGPASTSSTEGGAGESSDSTLTTRRMTVDDVTFADLAAHPLPRGYTQSAVSVDAWPAVEVLVDATDDEVVQARGDLAATLGGADMVVTTEVQSCELIAVWVLPQPDSVRVGHETHPDSAGCTDTTTYDVLFAIPQAGTNSEGAWDYTTTVPPIQLEVRAGAQN